MKVPVQEQNRMRSSGASRPPDKEGGGLKNNFFRPFGPQFDLKIRGGGRVPRAPPLDPPVQPNLKYKGVTFEEWPNDRLII